MVTGSVTGDVKASGLVKMTSATFYCCEISKFVGTYSNNYSMENVSHICAAITEEHRLGSLQRAETIFSHFRG